MRKVRGSIPLGSTILVTVLLTLGNLEILRFTGWLLQT